MDRYASLVPRFLFITGAYEGQELSPEGDRIRLGRAPSCEVRCDAYKDLRVGKLHAEVVAEGAKWLLRDLRSRNGALLNEAHANLKEKPAFVKET